MNKNIFQNGSVWLKADFHLHTKADSEFKFVGESNEFIKKYIEQLKSSNTFIGVITNHNKFDKDEFVALKKAAKKEGIWLVAGLEFSLKEGIHLLIAFEDEWYKGQVDNINSFIANAFYGINNYYTSPYPNSKFDLKEVVEALDNINLDYFLILPHPDDKNGLFKVLEGRTLEAFIQDDSFNKVIALQKSGNKNNYKKLCDLANRDIACVEGSNNAHKGIEGIGNERITYVKIGDFNFEALKYALTDEKNRISRKDKPVINNSYIKSIAFEGGLLDGTEIGFSPELNNFIGIRGSGKSSILEILRYTLGISLGNQASDKDYKNSLIEHVLKSGGKVKTTIIDEHKKEYRIEKIYGQKEDVYHNEERIDIPSIDTIFRRPVYFGQKDLSNKHIDFEADLVRKLIGNRLDAVKTDIDKKSIEITDIILNLKKLKNLAELKKEINASIADAKYKLKVFKEQGIESKLKQQSKFDTDVSRFKTIISEITNFKNDLHELYNTYESFFTDTKFETEENKNIFQQAENVFMAILTEFEKLRIVETTISGKTRELNELQNKLMIKKETLKEEFAKIKREIDIPNVNPDDFLKFNRTIETSKLKLLEIEKSEKKKAELARALNDRITELNQLWHKEYQILEKEVTRINKYENSLSISVTFKGRDDIFRDKLQQVFKGSGLRTATYSAIQKEYKDFIEVYRDLANIASKLNISSDTLVAAFKKRINENLEELLTFRVEDSFTIKYNEKPLKDHSLGQRATALILFLLAQKETDVLIIDQPEDDLDNQTIYEDVIKQIKELKGDMQFIFATHNANIPVLGDSEKIVSCKYLESRIDITDGSIDDHTMQKQIVTIMEGGEEAFNRRKNIYSIWNIDKRN
ncbi:MAG: histidinol-phosphatase [Bacteroidales bacterium]|nr:histidinol-phosphatase [Bacteroidales bacterium]